MVQNAGPERSLFEEGYLVRSLGAVAQQPDVALSELVANAWDAGASRVEITIPPDHGGLISVADDGVGLTPDQFRARWMKHGYLRVKHQGEYAEFPPERATCKRRAYGRNGIGRHGLFCFAGQYAIETRHYDSAEARRFVVEPSSGESAFVLISDDAAERAEHGTTVSAHAEYCLPDADAIYDALSFRFLHDPQFTICVNSRAIGLERHPVVDEHTIEIDDKTTATVLCVEVEPSKRRKVQHGVAFWIGGRLVGDPMYNLHGVPLLDGRTAVANRHMFVVKSDNLHDDILPDWTGFRRTQRIGDLANEVGQHLDSLVGKLMAERIVENKSQAIRENREEITKLKPLARIELNEFLDSLMAEHPTLNPEVLTGALRAAVNLEKSRAGLVLLEKLATISLDDIDGINRLLDRWTVRDALAVLDEIDRRSTVVNALKKLMGDSTADELHTIHPLVTHARWLFGPDYDSPAFASNVTIQSAAREVFKKRIDPKGIINPRQRPDLIFLKDCTISITGTEQFDDTSTVVVLQNLLLVELKKGGSTIVLKHRQQAEQYVQDLLHCKLLDGTPFINAFVVGHRVDDRVQPITVGEQPSVAKVTPISFGQLVRTAEKRLFRLSEIISERYKDIPGAELVDKVLGESFQKPLFTEGTKKRRRTKSTSKR